MLGITAGAHRLWAHRSYKASFPLRVVLMLANSIANQGSIWHWSRDHRVHHKHTEVS
jgi:stearoyl-CoA desaturase (delta-9 desaturase)